MLQWVHPVVLYERSRLVVKDKLIGEKCVIVEDHIEQSLKMSINQIQTDRLCLVFRVHLMMSIIRMVMNYPRKSPRLLCVQWSALSLELLLLWSVWFQWYASSKRYVCNNFVLAVVNLLYMHTSTTWGLMGSQQEYVTSQMIYHRGGEPERTMHCVMAHKPWITAEFVTVCCSGMSVVSNTSCSHFLGQWSYHGYTHA